MLETRHRYSVSQNRTGRLRPRGPETPPSHPGGSTGSVAAAAGMALRLRAHFFLSKQSEVNREAGLQLRQYTPPAPHVGFLSRWRRPGAVVGSPSLEGLPSRGAAEGRGGGDSRCRKLFSNRNDSVQAEQEG